MAIPRQVEEAAKKADEMMKEHGGVKEPPADEGNIVNENIPEGNPEEVSNETPEGKSEGTPETTPKSDKDGIDELLHKYKVLQGKYNAEVPRLAEEKRELAAKIKELETKLASLQENISIRQPEDEDDQSFVEEFPDIANYVNKALEKKLKEVSPDVTQKVDTLEKKVNKTAEDYYVEKLTKLVPDWQEIRDDPDFASSLEEVEPFSGKTKYDLALEAQNNLDADRVAQFYIDYKNKKQPRQKTTKKKVEDYVSPGAGNSPSPADTAQPMRTFTEKQIRDFYSALARGHFKGEEGKKQAQKIEAQIHAFLLNKNKQ